MDASLVFVSRIQEEIPCVSAGWEKLLSTYLASKGYHPLLGYGLTTAENFAHAATENIAVPLAKKFDGQIKNVDSLACKMLDNIEDNVPAVKQEPAKILENSKAVLDSGVSKLSSMKDVGVGAVSATKDAMLTAGQNTISTMLHLSMVPLSTTLDIVDAAVDKYLVDPTTAETHKPGREEETTFIGHAGHIATKAKDAVQVQAAAKYTTARDYVFYSINEMQTAVAMMEFAKVKRAQATENLSAAQERIQSLWSDLSKHAENYGKHPDVLLLDTTVSLAKGIAQASDYISGIVKQYPTAQPLATLLDGTKGLADPFTQAKSIDELKTETLQQAGAQLDTLRTRITSALDFVAEKLPAAWMPNAPLFFSSSNVSMDGEFDEEFIGINRSPRRQSPGQADTSTNGQLNVSTEL